MRGYYMIQTENASIIQEKTQTFQWGSQLAFVSDNPLLESYLDEVLLVLGVTASVSGKQLIDSLGLFTMGEGESRTGIGSARFSGKLPSVDSGSGVCELIGRHDPVILKCWPAIHDYLVAFPRYEEAVRDAQDGSPISVREVLTPPLWEYLATSMNGNRVSEWLDWKSFIRQLKITISQHTRHSKARVFSGAINQDLGKDSAAMVALFLGLEIGSQKYNDLYASWKNILELITEHGKYAKEAYKDKDKDHKKIAKEVTAIENKMSNSNKTARLKTAREHMSAVLMQCSAVGKRSARDGKHSEYFYMIDRTPQGNRAIELFACAKELQENALRDIASGLRVSACPYGKTREECSEMSGAIGDACKLDENSDCSVYKHAVYAYEVLAEAEFAYTDLQKVLNNVIEEQKCRNVKEKRPGYIKTISDDLQEPVRFRHPAPDYKRGTPRWNEILTRCSCPITLVCWIAKLFIPDDRSRRALYLRGTGKTGNTTIVNALNNYINAEEAELAGQITFDQDDASTFKVQQRAGKLLAVCGDTGNIGLFKTTAFKGITGDEQKAGEHKHGAMTTVDTYCKLIVTSNHLINIDPLQTASHSRVAYVTLKRVPDSIIADQNVVVADLVAELPLFVKNCREFWEREIKGKGLAPDGEVPVTKATAERMRELEYDSSKDIRDILHTCVVLAAPGETNKYKRKKVKPSGSKRYVDDDSFQEILIPASITQEDIIELYMSKSTVDQDVAIKGKDSAVANIFDYIERLYGVQKEVRSFMLPDGMAIYIEGIFGIKLVETPVQKVEITGLEIKEIDKDYGVYVGPVRYRQQLQLPKHTEQDIWGDFL